MLLAFTAMHSCAQNSANIFDYERSCAVPGLPKNIDQERSQIECLIIVFLTTQHYFYHIIYKLRDIDYSNHDEFINNLWNFNMY